jgi:hypothetical protein
MARMRPPLRASNEGLLRPRVARAQGTHRVSHPLLVDFSASYRRPMIRGTPEEKRMKEGGTASTDSSETGYRITRLPTHSYHCCRETGSVTVQPRSLEWEASVTAVDSLMLDAKQAIMDEHHRRFQTFYQEGRWEEALQEIYVTLSCATDLLNESLRVLDEAHDGATTAPPMVPLPLPQPPSE